MIAPSSSAERVAPWLLLLVAGLAWWPLLLARPVVADDHLNGTLAAEGFRAYWAHYGIWRSAGHPPAFWMRALFPGGDRVAALGVHLGATALFYALARRWISSPALQLAAGLVFAAMPFAFQALTWNSALSFALSTLCMLAACRCALQPVATCMQGMWVGAMAAGLSFLSLSANEASLGLVAWLAGYQALLAFERRESRPRWITAALIVAAEAAWVAAHLATKPADHPKSLAFHAPALVSGLFRQYGQLTYLTHLPRLGPWLPASAFLSAGLALVALLPLARGPVAAARRALRTPEMLAFLTLPIAAVAIYALGGGFSTDARKAYVFWPFLLLACARLLEGMSPRFQREVLWTAAGLCPLFILCAQAATQAWAQTGTRFEAAEALILQRHLPGPYRFQWQPDVYAAWPDFDPLCGFRFDTPWVVGTGVGPGAELPGPSRTLLVWQPASGRWESASP